MKANRRPLHRDALRERAIDVRAGPLANLRDELRAELDMWSAYTR